MNDNHYENLDVYISKQVKERYNQAQIIFFLVNKTDNSLAKTDDDHLILAANEYDAYVFKNSLKNKEDWDVLKCKKDLLQPTITTFKNKIGLIAGKNKIIINTES